MNDIAKHVKLEADLFACHPIKTLTCWYQWGITN